MNNFFYTPISAEKSIEEATKNVREVLDRQIELVTLGASDYPLTASTIAGAEEIHSFISDIPPAVYKVTLERVK